MEGLPNTAQDEATRRTAQDALFSKISAAKLGYFTDDYSKLFTTKQKKMMPIINRGTWTRLFSVRSFIDCFINKFKDQKTQILSLGAGLDTNYFYYEENDPIFKEHSVKYFEVDFQEITTAKIKVIKENESLQNLIFKDSPSNYPHDDSINAARYKLIPCDIRETESLRDKLVDFGIDSSTPTLVVTE